ncbi:MAG TPA: hypothetical protein VJL90_08790 [Pseudorhodoplanes sp.]|nr:hypothetical protein [Pseudorhodoplanes sp.]
MARGLERSAAPTAEKAQHSPFHEIPDKRGRHRNNAECREKINPECPIIQGRRYRRLTEDCDQRAKAPYEGAYDKTNRESGREGIPNATAKQSDPESGQEQKQRGSGI